MNPVICRYVTCKLTCRPLAAMMSMTSEPLSDEVMKYTTIENRMMMVRTANAGRRVVGRVVVSG